MLETAVFLEELNLRKTQTVERLAELSWEYHETKPWTGAAAFDRFVKAYFNVQLRIWVLERAETEVIGADYEELLGEHIQRLSETVRFGKATHVDNIDGLQLHLDTLIEIRTMLEQCNG